MLARTSILALALTSTACGASSRAPMPDPTVADRSAEDLGLASAPTASTEGAPTEGAPTEGGEDAARSTDDESTASE